MFKTNQESYAAEAAPPQNEFTTTLRGYDVTVLAVEGEDAYKVEVMEGDGLPWEVIIPVDLDAFEGDNEALDGSDKVMAHVTEAAVDLFEADRGTLGQGAGSVDNDGVVAMKKQSLYCMSEDWEDWFLKMKGTPFEEEAHTLLEQLLATQLIPCDDPDRQRLEQQERQISYDLDLLNLRRMKECCDCDQTIIIQARYGDPIGSKTSYWCFESIEAYLDKFDGTDLEREAIMKVQELLSIQKQIDGLEVKPDKWDKEQEIRNQMNELSLTLMQQNAMPASSGVGPDSNLAKDMKELMEVVDIPTPPSLDDIGGDPIPISDLQEAARGYGDEGLLPPIASGVRIAFSEVEPVADRVDELGHIRDDLDPGLIEPKQFAFNTNERVQLTEEIEARIGWGTKKTYPVGTKGHAESQYDKQGDYYQVRLDDNQLIKVRWDQMKATAKD